MVYTNTMLESANKIRNRGLWGRAVSTCCVLSPFEVDSVVKPLDPYIRKTHNISQSYSPQFLGVGGNQALFYLEYNRAFVVPLLRRRLFSVQHPFTSVWYPVGSYLSKIPCHIHVTHVARGQHIGKTVKHFPLLVTQASHLRTVEEVPGQCLSPEVH